MSLGENLLTARCHMSSSSSERQALRSPSENCIHLKKLGYLTGKQINLYGEHIELVSDPYVEGDRVVAKAISSNDKTIRTIDLPLSILGGFEEIIQEPTTPRGSGQN